jgi:hypothetical protein
MKFLKYVPAIAIGTAIQLVTVGAFAQPDPNNVPKVENPANRPVGGGRNRPQIQQLDPAALQAMMQQRAKMQLQRAGITDVEQQEAILTYTQGEEEAETKLRQKGVELQRAIRTDTLSNAQLVALVNEYHVAIEDNKERHAKALSTLKETVDFSKNPRIEAFLLLTGLYGEGPVITSFNIGAMGGRGQLNTPRAGLAQGGAQPGGAAFGQFGAPQGGNAQGTTPFGQFGAPQGQRPNNRANGNTPNNPATGAALRRNLPRNNTPEAPAAPLGEL